MKTQTFSTTYHVYYSYGSVWTGTLINASKSLLEIQMKKFANIQEKSGDVEVVTFEPIQQMVTTSARFGKYKQFKPITNQYMGGLTSPNPKYFKQL